jgi:large subunit ribosomal protein L46
LRTSKASRATVSRQRIPRPLRRTLATEANLGVSPEEISQPSTEPYTPRALPYKLFTSLVLARAPLLTPTPTPFESAYYSYQARIHRALSTPFPSEFYFKKGTLLERRFLAEERIRERAAFGDGFDGEEGAERLEDVPSEEDEIRPLPREHESDRTGDVKNLNRQGERNLYLLVQSKEGKSWRFPFWTAGLGQPLHKV